MYSVAVNGVQSQLYRVAFDEKLTYRMKDMHGVHARVAFAAAAALLCSWCSSFAAEGDRSSAVAKAILEESGIRGGLVVHLNCGEGTLTAALCANDRYIVQGLESDIGLLH